MDNSSGNTISNNFVYPQPTVCPTCGKCPTCGSGGYAQPYITWTTQESNINWEELMKKLQEWRDKDGK